MKAADLGVAFHLQMIFCKIFGFPAEDTEKNIFVGLA